MSFVSEDQQMLPYSTILRCHHSINEHNINELLSTFISYVTNEWPHLPLERALFSEHQARGKKKIDFPAALSPVAMVTLQTPLSPFHKEQTLPVYEPVCSDHTLALDRISVSCPQF